jgi:hypothetical protein
VPDSWHKTKSHICQVSGSPSWGTRDGKVGRQKMNAICSLMGAVTWHGSRRRFFSQKGNNNMSTMLSSPVTPFLHFPRPAFSRSSLRNDCCSATTKLHKQVVVCMQSTNWIYLRQCNKTMPFDSDTIDYRINSSFHQYLILPYYFSTSM